MQFNQRLSATIENRRSHLCVGLDTVPASLPPHITDDARPLVTFNREIIRHTEDLVAAYKLNIAFYEAHGSEGWEALEETRALIPPDVIVIADGKWGDIGTSASRAAVAAFEHLRCDAVTVNPLMGSDSLAPFLKEEERGAFVLCLTSNPGAEDFQMREDPAGEPLHEAIARRAAAWNKRGNCGLVVGATRPDALTRIRSIAPELPTLIPGVGAQGGDLDAVVAATISAGESGFLINASRSVIYASSGEDFGVAAREAAKRLRDSVETVMVDAVEVEEPVSR